MDSLRKLGIEPHRAKSMTISYDGIEIENFVFNGQAKVVEMDKGGELHALTEMAHIRFVD